ncbi:hypothetical protein JXA47_08825 [Candidatus Sumerlaeota bacterium]|nr:hypothetical protein [Candidatus Sumerlaeota bacterium]
MALLVGSSFGAVVINELVWDDASTDDVNYIELYDGGALTDISGYTVEGVNGANGAVYATITIPAATTMPADGFYVIGMNGTIPNVDLINALADIQVGAPDALLLRDSGAVLLDAIGYEFRSTGAGSLTAGQWEGTGYTPSGQGSPTTCSVGRYTDGVDTNNNSADFGMIPASPGFSNVWTTASYPYVNDFTGTDGSPETEFSAEFVVPYIQDPTVADAIGSGTASNPNAIAASPGGGNIGVLWDDTGGGDSAVLQAPPFANGYVECYVYLNGNPASAEAAGNGDGWSIILRGATGPFYNGSETFNGDTGITIQNRNDDGALFSSPTRQSIQFREEGDNTGSFDGSSAPVQVLREVFYTTGTNDGWQRVRLDCNGTDVVTFFGGTLGTTTDESGSKQVHTVAWTSPGVFTIGYREGFTDNTVSNPLRMDDLTVSDTGQIPVEMSIFATD